MFSTDCVMRALTLAATFCLLGLSAFGGNGNDQGQNNNDQGHRGAPAPLIGAGIPGAIAVGGVLLSSRLFRRNKK